MNSLRYAYRQLGKRPGFSVLIIAMLALGIGATPAFLRSLVLEQVGTMAVIGVPLGVAVALGLGRAAESLLFGLSGFEPVVLALAILTISFVVFLAGFIPARRASRVAPMEALRYE